jgi:NH3-dependent NAD+ synthetase
MNHASSRIWAPVFLGVALLLALLVVKPLYSEYIDKSSTLALLVKQTEKTKSEYEALLKIKERTASGTSDDLSLRVKKLGKKWNTSDIMEIVMLSDFTRPTVGQ